MIRTCVLIPTAIMLSVGLPACSVPVGGNDPNGNNSADVRIPETTKMLSAADLDALEAPAGDLSQLVFSADTEMLADLAADDVLVTGVDEGKLPYGMLRRVVSIDRSGGNVTVQTEQATLTEAIERGSLRETFTLSADMVAKRVSPADGSVTLKSGPAQQGGPGFVFAINDYELYDADGDPATREDRVWVEGNFSFAPTIDFEIDIDGFELETLVFEIGSEQQASIRVTAGRQAIFDEVEVLETIELTPITFSIGPIPVVLVPLIQLRVGVNGSVTADLTAGVQTDATVRIGFGYQNGSWGPVSEFDPTASFDAPNFRDGARGTAKVWAGPRAELAAYGVAGVFGELRGFVQGDVDSAADPWWTLSAGVEALAGAFLRVLDTTIADYQTDPLTASIELADAGGPAPSEQAEVITWARSLGGDHSDNIDNPLAVIVTSDGGSLVVGGTNSFTSSPSDAWLIKLDRLGQISWQRAIENIGTALGVVEHPAGGYIILFGVVGTGANDTRVLRVDANGDPVWGYLYDSILPAAGYGLLASGDDFVIGGVHGGGVSAQFWLAKIDQNGQPLWSRALGGDSGDQIDGFSVGEDGAIVAVGPTHSFGVSFNGHWVVKFDRDGNVEWQNAYDGSGNEWAHAVVADQNGNYKIVGRTGSDALVTLLDGNGNLLSAATYDAGSPYEEAFTAVGLPDGGLLIAGNTGLGDDSDLWLLRLTPQLEVLWTTSYGGAQRDEAGGTIQYGAVSRPLAMTDDEGFLVLANTESFGATAYDIWVQKVSGTGVVTYNAGSEAMRAALAGSYQEYAITATSTNAEVSDVNLIVTPIDPVFYTPAPRIVTQATP